MVFYQWHATIILNKFTDLQDKLNSDAFLQNTILTYLLPGMPLSCRAATKVFHFCLSLVIFSIVPQEWFIDFSSPSTVHLHVLFGLPRLRFPFGVQCNAVLVMEFWSLLITYAIHFQRLLIKIVAILSWWHYLSRSSLENLLGQKMRRILLKRLVWKSDSLFESFSVILQHSDPYSRVDSTQLW